MKAYLIDPNNRTIKTVNIDSKNALHDIYKFLDCSTIDAVRLSNGDVVYVDDEALLHGPVYQWVGLKGYHQPLAGKALVIGTDEDGDNAEPNIDIKSLKKMVFWIERLTENIWGIVPFGKKKVTLSSISAIQNYLTI